MSLAGELPDIELHRGGIAVVPAPGEKDSALWVREASGLRKPLRSCTCKASKRKTCEHLHQLSKRLRQLEEQLGERRWDEVIATTVWYRLARQLFDGDPADAAAVQVGLPAETAAAVRVLDGRGEELARYLDDSPARVRFLERLSRAPRDGRYVDRGALLDRLALFQATAEERALNKAGARTQRQAWQASFWHRLAYHCLREWGEAGSFHPAVDGTSGRFTLTFRRPGETGPGAPVVQVSVPRQRVQAVLELLAKTYRGQADLAIHPVPLRSLFKVSQRTELDLEVRPVIEALQADGESRYIEQESFEKFRYGRLVYVKELGVLAELEQAGKDRKFRAPVRMKLERSKVPSFLEEHREALTAGSLVLDDPLRDLRIFKGYDRLEIIPEALDRSWYWMSLSYGFGNQTVSLGELLAARQRGQPYLEVTSGWIDLSAPAFGELDRLAQHHEPSGGGQEGRLKLSASELLRLRAAAEAPLEVAGDAGRRALVERLLALQPAAPYRHPDGLVSDLRPYQRLGVEWLSFLSENRLGGLLCDDMGLGKTHQAMALMLTLAEGGEEGPFLVVAPTSVLPHWQAKLRQHAPGLAVALHHGPQRNLAAALAEARVLLTSYGVLRRDAEELARTPLRLAVFDEIQQLKNRDTLAHQAAQRLAAEVKLGLTGTPVENSLADLKALFDLVLPGYLGSDAAFAERFAAAEGEVRDPRCLAELKRLVSPFVLRRTKAAVLSELPAKFEDLRTCSLSDDQVALYREVVATRGKELAERIGRAEEPLPYIHVFAVLNLLKQICDHPALAVKELDRADDYRSGKWELYTELLSEALGSGQKVVVFSQYLGMLELMARQLEERGVGFATLTGASRKRGEVVERFNTDPDCHVFLGSLKAGGTGIDLVGGSVVIHYDRWWNAAREDQATDRVHRIGQHRAVQVFKLITEGTLEEKIAALIEEKRRLMESVVEEDEPHLAKLFSREQLLELLETV